MWRSRFAMEIPAWLLERWILVAYLQPAPEGLVDKIRARPDERFFEVLGEHLQAYVRDGAQPPAEIASAVYNLADDYLNGRQMTLRTGDYIAVQNFTRGAQMSRKA